MPPEPSYAALRDAYAAAWRDAEPALRAVAGTAPFEVRYSLLGQAAIRQDIGTPVRERHVEPADLDGDEVVSAACGQARGWLVSAAPIGDRDAASSALAHAVDRTTALVFQALRLRRDVVNARLAEREIHRMRADVSALETAWEVATQNVLTEDELAEFRVAIGETTRSAHARLSHAAVYQRALDHGQPATALDLASTWTAAVAGLPEAGTPELQVADGEQPQLWLPEPLADWCLAMIATAVRDDPRLNGRDPRIAVRPHPVGWELAFGAHASATSSERWPEAGLGELDRAGGIALTAGGDLGVQRDESGGLRVSVAFPASA